MSMIKKAIYPGSFDPVTYGHLDILRRAAPLFDEITASVAYNSKKKYVFTIEERVHLIKEAVKDIENITVEISTGLSVDFAKYKGASVIIRGIRNVSDLEYERQMEYVNSNLNRDIVTIYLSSSQEFSLLTSSLVKEVASYGADISKFVPPNVESALKTKLNFLKG